MTWCHMAPRHYLKECWLVISKVVWHSPKGKFSGGAQIINLWNEFEYDTFRIIAKSPRANKLTHWGRVTHICVSKLTIIGSDNGLSPGQRQAIFWTSAEILLTGSLATNFSEILIEIQTFSFKKMQLKMSSAKWRPFCLGLNVLTHWVQVLL